MHSTLGEGGVEANQGGCIDLKPKGFDGGFWGAVQVHIVCVLNHADVQERIPCSF
jgi:hypothetical protein